MRAKRRRVRLRAARKPFLELLLIEHGAVVPIPVDHPAVDAVIGGGIDLPAPPKRGRLR